MTIPHIEFTFFPALPTELRIDIWQHAINHPRIIEIRTDDYPGNIEYIPNARGIRVSDIRWVTKCPPPAALSVCRESREEALKVYTIRFALLASGEEIIYINPLIDTVYIQLKWRELFPILLKDIRAFHDADDGLRSLAVNMTFFLGDISLIRVVRAIFTKLEKLTLVIERSVNRPYGSLEDWDRDCAFVAPETELEIRDWEQGGRRAMGLLERERNWRNSVLDLQIVAIRRGEAARGLGDKTGEHCMLEGPMRPYPDLDPMQSTFLG